MVRREELVARIQAVRHRLAEDGPSALREPGDFERVSIPMADADRLRDVLREENPRVVVEVGLAYGASALAIAEALAEVDASDRATHHLIVDAFQDQFGDAGWQALVEAGVADRTTLLRERSQIALARLAAEGFRADAAFVDGSHIFHNVFIDLVFVGELVGPGGLAVLDDCDWPSVGMAVRYFELNAGWLREPRDLGRLRAYRLPDPPVVRSFEDFRPF